MVDQDIYNFDKTGFQIKIITDSDQLASYARFI